MQSDSLECLQAGNEIMKVLFRVDGNSKIGLGHLQRCLSLARAFVLRKCDVVFLVKREPIANERVEQFGFKVHNIESNLTLSEDLQATLKFLQHESFQIVIADSYEFDEDYLLALGQAGYRVAFIDDLARMSFPCHFVINGAIYAEKLDYHSSTGDTQFLLGPKYMLLREEFWNIPKRIIKPEVENILVTLGGSDPNNVTSIVLDTLLNIDGDCNVYVIVGPFFDNVTEIESAAMGFGNGRVQLLHSPTSVCDLMLDCDLAISGGGQTLYELAATGTPTIAMKLADNQQGNIQGLKAAGAIDVIENMDDLRISLLYLRSNLPDRENMSAAGQRVVSGDGAMLVAKYLTVPADGDVI